MYRSPNGVYAGSEDVETYEALDEIQQQSNQALATNRVREVMSERSADLSMAYQDYCEHKLSYDDFCYFLFSQDEHCLGLVPTTAVVKHLERADRNNSFSQFVQALKSLDMDQVFPSPEKRAQMPRHDYDEPVHFQDMQQAEGQEDVVYAQPHPATETHVQDHLYWKTSEYPDSDPKAIKMFGSRGKGQFIPKDHPLSVMQPTIGIQPHHIDEGDLHGKVSELVKLFGDGLLSPVELRREFKGLGLHISDKLGRMINQSAVDGVVQYAKYMAELDLGDDETMDPERECGIGMKTLDDYRRDEVHAEGWKKSRYKGRYTHSGDIVGWNTPRIRGEAKLGGKNTRVRPDTAGGVDFLTWENVDQRRLRSDRITVQGTHPRGKELYKSHFNLI